jgi:hypothetical protein
MRGVLDIDVAEPQLEPPRVVPRIRQQMPARVPEHVRVRVGQPCAFARSLNHLRHIEARHWPAAFTGEHKRALSRSAQFAQRSQFVRFCCWCADEIEGGGGQNSSAAPKRNQPRHGPHEADAAGVSQNGKFAVKY